MRRKENLGSHLLNPISQAFISWLRLCIWNSPLGMLKQQAETTGPAWATHFFLVGMVQQGRATASWPTQKVDPPEEKKPNRAWVLQEDLVFCYKRSWAPLNEETWPGCGFVLVAQAGQVSYTGSLTSQCPACHSGEMFSPFFPPPPLPYQIQAGSAKSLAGGTLAGRQFSDTPLSILHPNPCVVWFTT